MGYLVRFLMRKFLPKQDFFLPSYLPEAIFKSGELDKLEHALRTKSPIVLAKYLEQSPGLNKEMLGQIGKDIAIRFSKDSQPPLNTDDLKLIKYFSESPHLGTIKFFRIAESAIMNENALNELKGIAPAPPHVSACVLLWIYLSMYEVILDLMTVELMQKLKESKLQKKSRAIEIITRRMDRIINGGQHLEAGLISEALEDLEVLSKKNESIIGKGRGLRNDVGHGNVRYVEEKDEYLFMNGKTWSTKEFMAEFERLLNFLYGWTYYLNNESPDLIAKIDGEFQRQAKKLRTFPRFGFEKLYRSNLIWLEGQELKEEKEKLLY